MNGFLRSVSLSLLALVLATRPCRAADPVSPAADAEPEAKASNVQSLQFHGAVTWQINGAAVSFHAASVANIGTSTVPVSVALMAATQPPRFGDDLSQARVLARTTVGSLPAGSQTGVDSGTIAFSRPPSGTYYIFASAEILQGGIYVSQDIFSFPNTETFGATCTQDALTLCLGGGRFAVRSTWTVPSQATSGVGGALPLVGGDTGYFWFFSSNAAELMVKMVDGRTLNGNFWVFYGALSNVQYTISITDTQTGGFKTYQNPSGNLASVADTSAFADGSGSGPLAGTWRGTFNTTDPNCAGVTGAIGTGAFVQNGNNFAGTFNLPGNSSGSFQGSISGNTVSGVFTSNTAAGCTGTGNFTGTLSGNDLTVSAPAITTPQQGCVFCQNNTIILTKTGG